MASPGNDLSPARQQRMKSPRNFIASLFNHAQKRRHGGTKSESPAVEIERNSNEISSTSSSPQPSTLSGVESGGIPSSHTLGNRPRLVAHRPDAQYPSEEHTTHVEKQPVASSFHGAHDFSVGGNSRFINIAEQNVDYYSGIRGLDILKDFVSFPALHDSSAQDPERRCHHGTRENILKQMRNWIDDLNTTERILWLYGPAGVGKSAIAQTVSQLYDRDKVAATFFFFRSDPDRSDGNRLFPTLAWQLAISVPEIREYMARFLNDNPDLPRKAVEIQFEHLISRPLQALIENIPLMMQTMPVVVIDGIDECSDLKLQRRLLNVLVKAIVENRFPLRFLISCRPEAHIQDVFDKFQHVTLAIDLANINDSYLDIQKYLEDEFSRIVTEQTISPSTWPGQSVIKEFVDKSSGQFVYASTIIKFVSDEYSSAPSQLDIVRGLKPSRGKSPFAELDALYIEILQRQPDQDFLKDFLSILIAFLEITAESPYDLTETWGSPSPIRDDAPYLLQVDAGELYRKLRGMHSLLKFSPSDPGFSAYHQSFLDFLEEPSRSRQYHISKHSATKKYLELITSALVKYASKVIKEPDYHELEHFFPSFGKAMMHYRVWVKLPIQDWEETLRPLRTLQDDLLKFPNLSSPWRRGLCRGCSIFYVIDDLLLRLSTIHAQSNVNLSSFRDRLLALEAGDRQFRESKYHDGVSLPIYINETQSIPTDLDGCLDLLLSHLRSIKSEQSISIVMINLFNILLRYGHAESALKVCSVSDAQHLVDFTYQLINDKNHSIYYDVRCNAIQLALGIYARIPLLPPLFLNKVDFVPSKNPGSVIFGSKYQGEAVVIREVTWTGINPLCQTAFLLGVLSHENLCPFLGFCESRPYEELFAVFQYSQKGTLRDWRSTSNPSVLQIQEHMLEVAKGIQYLHSLGVVLGDEIEGDTVFMDSGFHAKILPHCICPQYFREVPAHYTNVTPQYWDSQNDVFWFGRLFYEVCFDTHLDREDREDLQKKLILQRLAEPEIRDETWKLVEQCCAADPKNRPTMDDIVREMESWS